LAGGQAISFPFALRGGAFAGLQNGNGGGVFSLSIEHVGLWTEQLEAMRDFYSKALGGQSGPRYENRQKGFQSYLLSFGSGARLEIMSRVTGHPAAAPGAETRGYAHVAYRTGSRAGVDALVGELESRGVPILGRPRVTGDGYYEALIADPDGNRIEIVE
jgi:lactoylglutathione lyase